MTVETTSSTQFLPSSIMSISRLPDLRMEDPPASPAAVADPPAPVTPAAGTPAPVPPADDKSGDDSDWLSKLPENQQAFYRKLQSENKNLRSTNSDLKAKEATRAEAEAEAQRKLDEDKGNWKKIAEEAEQKLKAKDERLLRAELRAHAIKEGIIDASIIDILPLDGVSLNAEGEVVGVDKFVSKYKKEKSYLFGEVKTKTPEGTTRPNVTPPTPNAGVTMKNALEMTDEEFKTARLKWLSENKK